MNPEICTDLRKRYDVLMQERATPQQEWDDIEAFVTPYRGRFFSEQKAAGSIDWDRGFCYDSTAITAHQNLAASLHGSLSSPSIRWFELRFRDEKLNKNKAVAAWLYDANEALYYSLQDSNFNTEVNETYQDVAGFGTAALVLEEEGGGLAFSAIPIKEFCFEEDYRGLVLRFYRKFQWSAAKIMSKFGDQVPENVKEAAAAGKTEPLDVLFCIYPTGNKVVPVGKKVAPSRRPWQACYFMYQGQEMLGRTTEYYEMPVFIPRWRKTSCSVWGNSPAHFAINDIKSLNRVRKDMLMASEKAIDPTVLVEERAIMGSFDFSASSVNVVRSIAGIKVFDAGINLAVGQFDIEQLQASIKDHFFTDQLRLPDPQGTPATAYEISIRYQQMQKLLGPTLGRLQNDLLTPIITRAFKVLARAGTIAPPPQQVIDANAQYDIEYIGSLSAAQKADRAAGIERFVVAVGNMAGVLPKALDVVNEDETVRQLARDLAIPPLLLRVELLQDERDAQAQAMSNAVIAEQQGAANQALAEAQLTQSSPINPGGM
jgi:Bacteriophage head to tail connecting protein